MAENTLSILEYEATVVPFVVEYTRFTLWFRVVQSNGSAANRPGLWLLGQSTRLEEDVVVQRELARKGVDIVPAVCFWYRQGPVQTPVNLQVGSRAFRIRVPLIPPPSRRKEPLDSV